LIQPDRRNVRSSDNSAPDFVAAVAHGARQQVIFEFIREPPIDALRTKVFHVKRELFYVLEVGD